MGCPAASRTLFMEDRPYVLIVEDDPYFGKICQTKLRRENIATQLVDTGREALTLMRQDLPALILLDLIMPGKNGFETLAEIKADPQLKDIPVITLSNLSEPEDIERMLTLGAVDYLVKANVPIQEIVTKVKQHLKG